MLQIASDTEQVILCHVLTLLLDIPNSFFHCKFLLRVMTYTEKETLLISYA